MAPALTFLERYHKDGDEFLNHIVRVTGDETRVSFVNVETKEQSKQWMHTHSPNNVSVFMSPSDRVAQLYPQAPVSLFVAFYDSQG
jgi:hypothetical protein